MKRFLQCIILSMIIVSVSFGIYKLSKEYNLDLTYENIDWSIVNKSVKGAVSFDFDREYNLYIAFKDTIKVITKDNNEQVVISDKSLNIYDIACISNYLIIATENKVISYDLSSKKYNEIVSNLPNVGLNNKTKIILNGENLYITIGSNTNAGIVNEVNKNQDIASFEWISTGIGYKGNYGFSKAGEKIEKGQKIKEGIFSNASILKYNLNTGKCTTYATGIRNIEGLDTNSRGEIKAIVGGIEEESLRNVKDDVDYIYDIKEKAWYGWPDFSGGDPITSPRFLDGNNTLSYIIENHPTEVPLPPIYQHDKLKSLNGLAIDKEGKCFQKDTIIFADNKEHCIYVLTQKGTSKKIVNLKENSFIEKIRYNDSSIYFLDNKDGCIYRIQGEIKNEKFDLPNVIWIFIVVFVMIIIMIIMYKTYNNK